MKLACLALLSVMALAGCAPTMEMREGDERDRLIALVRQFCAAEQSSDPGDTKPLLVESLRQMLDDRNSPSAHLTSADPRGGCEPGRIWYLGGSRMFAEVRLADRNDRLDLWRGDWPRIGDVIYGSRRQVGSRRYKSLRAELIAETGGEMAAVAPPPLSDTECLRPGHRFAFVATDSKIYRQGAVVKLTPAVDISPAGTAELPLRCTSAWSVTGPATLSPDRSSLTIAPDAPAGSTVAVRFTHLNKPVEARFKVVARDEIVLTGRYGQRSLEGCSATQPVGELEFQPENRFAVTFMPFETYRDYWGTYSFDPATKRLRLTVEGGNFVPSNLDPEGEAELTEGGLRLKDMFLGSREGAPQSGCTYVF